MAAIVCLLIASLLTVSMLRAAVRDQRQARTRHWELQANWLAEAGIERAIARLRADREYRGETWNVSAEELQGDDAGRVEIRIEPSEGPKSEQRVVVLADYPDHPVRRARANASVLINDRQK